MTTLTSTLIAGVVLGSAVAVADAKDDEYTAKERRMRRVFGVALLTVCFLQVSAQQLTIDDASDPVSMLTRLPIDIESYFFHDNSQFYAARPGYYYGLGNERHLFGMSLAYVHSIFEGDYAGYENTTGFGDLKMTYLFVPFLESVAIGLERVTLSFDASAPTGESKLGRGTGVWMYKPGVIFSWRVAPSVIFYPEIRYQFSTSEANSLGGSDGTPDTDDPEKDDVVKNLSLSFPATVHIAEWNGWFALNFLYTRSLSENRNFLFLRTDIGKVIGNKSCASLRITKFISGDPVVDVVVQVNITFFMR